MTSLSYRKLFSRGVISSVALARGRFATLGGAYASASDIVAGVTESEVAAERLASLITGFSALVEASAAIAAGDAVGPAGDGSGRAVSGGSAGRALTAATAAGQLVEVELFAAGGVKLAAGGVLLGPDGSALALGAPAGIVTLTATGLLFTGACLYGGFKARAVSGTVNVVVYDATSATGTAIDTRNAIAVGDYPWLPGLQRPNATGGWVVISGGGSCTLDFVVAGL